jgi:hypothetical protein
MLSKLSDTAVNFTSPGASDVSAPRENVCATSTDAVAVNEGDSLRGGGNRSQPSEIPSRASTQRRATVCFTGARTGEATM